MEQQRVVQSRIGMAPVTSFAALPYHKRSSYLEPEADKRECPWCLTPMVENLLGYGSLPKYLLNCGDLVRPSRRGSYYLADSIGLDRLGGRCVLTPSHVASLLEEELLRYLSREECTECGELRGFTDRDVKQSGYDMWEDMHWSAVCTYCDDTGLSDIQYEYDDYISEILMEEQTHNLLVRAGVRKELVT